MILRLHTFLTGCLALLLAALLAFAPVGAKPASGGYQLFGGAASGHQADIPLAALGNFDYFAKVAPECCNAPNTAGGQTGFSGSRGNPLEQPNFQPVRNTPTTIGDRTFSGHALDQMQNRGIPPSVVEDAISPANYVGPGNRPNTSVYYSSTNGVRVITNDGGDVVTVITAPRQ